MQYIYKEIFNKYNLQKFLLQLTNCIFSHEKTQYQIIKLTWKYPVLLKNIKYLQREKLIYFKSITPSNYTNDLLFYENILQRAARYKYKPL